MIAILTDFASVDHAYSICTVALNQVKMLNALGYRPRFLARPGFSLPPGLDAEVVVLDPGRIGNTIEIDNKTEAEIANLTGQLESALEGVRVVLAHDLIFQATLFKYHIAARRLAQRRPDLTWLNIIHSAAGPRSVGRYQKEITGKFPRSKLLAFHPEEIDRKGALFGYERDEIIVLPNAIDFTEHYHPLANQILAESGAWEAGIVAVYPARLDRGKQPHILIEIFEHLRAYNPLVIIADFHSTGEDDKAVYRREMRQMATEKGVRLFFASDIGGYELPGEVIHNLFNFADIFIHPSRSECDPLILHEAMWHGCALVLNYDLPMFRLYDGLAQFSKFSSSIDVLTGLPGESRTEYGNRAAYMKKIAGVVAYHIENNPVLAGHIRARRERSLVAVGRKLWNILQTLL